MKGKLFSKRLWSSIFIIAIIVVLIIVAFSLMNNNGMHNNKTSILEPETVLNNYNKYIGENITVAGFFYELDAGDSFAYVHSKRINEPIKQGDLEEGDSLLINYAAVSNISNNVQKYYFHGNLKESNFSDYDIDLVYLNVTSIELI